MQVKTKVHESQVDRVKAGRPCRITVDAVPGREYRGYVKSVAILADSSWNWRNPDVKQYLTIVKIEDATHLLKPGMTAEVEILVARRPDVPVVPMQAVRLHKEKTVCYVLADETIQRREVSVGMNNDKLVEIEKGLAEGETVLLTLPKSYAQQGAGAYFTAKRTDRFRGRTAHTQPTASQPATTQPAATQPADRGMGDLKALVAPKKLTPAQAEALKAKLKDMTPEQRRQLLGRLRRGRTKGRTKRHHRP